jgi:hypothetical protein
VPEVYELHHRIVDLEGYVTVRSARYSVPYTLIGRRLEVRETKKELVVFEGPHIVAQHRRAEEPNARVTDLAHRPPRGQRARTTPGPEERQLLEAAPEITTYVADIKKRSYGRGTVALRRLLRLLHDYPRPSFLQAVRVAAEYGLYDLDRLERMILRNVRRDFFPHHSAPENSDDGEGTSS